MNLEIFAEQNQVTLKLSEKGRAIDPVVDFPKATKSPGSKHRKIHYGVDSETFLYYHDLGDLLISSLDRLLERNNIDTLALKSFKINGNLGKDSTSYKIVQSFVEALKIKI